MEKLNNDQENSKGSLFLFQEVHYENI